MGITRTPVQELRGGKRLSATFHRMKDKLRTETITGDTTATFRRTLNRALTVTGLDISAARRIKNNIPEIVRFMKTQSLEFRTTPTGKVIITNEIQRKILDGTIRSIIKGNIPKDISIMRQKLMGAGFNVPKFR